MAVTSGQQTERKDFKERPVPVLVPATKGDFLQITLLLLVNNPKDEQRSTHTTLSFRSVGPFFSEQRRLSNKHREHLQQTRTSLTNHVDTSSEHEARSMCPLAL